MNFNGRSLCCDYCGYEGPDTLLMSWPDSRIACRTCMPKVSSHGLERVGTVEPADSNEITDRVSPRDQAMFSVGLIFGVAMGFIVAVFLMVMSE